jgi:hypothetical protein
LGRHIADHKMHTMMGIYVWGYMKEKIYMYNSMDNEKSLAARLAARLILLFVDLTRSQSHFLLLLLDSVMSVPTADSAEMTELLTCQVVATLMVLALALAALSTLLLLAGLFRLTTAVVAGGFVRVAIVAESHFLLLLLDSVVSMPAADSSQMTELLTCQVVVLA